MELKTFPPLPVDFFRDETLKSLVELVLALKKDENYTSVNPVQIDRNYYFTTQMCQEKDGHLVKYFGFPRKKNYNTKELDAVQRKKSVTLDNAVGSTYKKRVSQEIIHIARLGREFSHSQCGERNVIFGQIHQKILSLLLAAGGSAAITYANIIGFEDYDPQPISSVKSLNPDIQPGNNNPFYHEFITGLMKKYPEQFDAVIVDYPVTEICEVLRQAGYQKPVICITGFEEDLPPALRNITSELSLSALAPSKDALKQQATDLVSIHPMDTFGERLRTTLEEHLG